MKLRPKQKKFADEYIICGNATREISIVKYMEERRDRCRTDDTRRRATTDLRIYAVKRIARRFQEWDSFITDQIIEECLCVIGSKSSTYERRKAARALLDLRFGSARANNMVDRLAIVDDRQDPLVRKWKKRILKRDKKCQRCGSDRDLHVHHISHWADDPLNRVNDSNGIVLCSACHAAEHPELNAGVFGGGSIE